MDEKMAIEAVERVAAGLAAALQEEYSSPFGGVNAWSQWCAEDFFWVRLAGSAGCVTVLVTSAADAEELAARVVVTDFTKDSSAAQVREVERVARVVAANPAVADVEPDGEWRQGFLAVVSREGADS